MSILDMVGLALIVIGVVEFVIFRAMAPSKPNIARILNWLYANSAFNVIVGIVLIAI